MSHHGTPDQGLGRTPLIVLQCIKCNKVLSDSSALVFSDERRDVICVKAASHIVTWTRRCARGRSPGAVESNRTRRIRPRPLPLAAIASPHLTSRSPVDEPLRTP